jgi:hypothetical protein
MEATTRATLRARSNREQRVVTRHGLRPSHAATPPSRRMPPGAPFAKISATPTNMSRGRFPIHGPPGEDIHSPSPRLLENRATPKTTTAEQNTKSP